MKDFDDWNNKKKDINFSQKRVIPKKGEIWFCNFGVNMGFEIDGKGIDFERPGLVLCSFFENGALVVPLTSKKKKSKFNFCIGERGFVNLTQIKYVDTKRFKRKIGEVDNALLRLIKERFIKIFFSY